MPSTGFAGGQERGFAWRFDETRVAGTLPLGYDGGIHGRTVIVPR